MKPDLFFSSIVDPWLRWLQPIAQVPYEDRARVLVMTIAGQEANWMYRLQIGGPARSYWQFEKGGGAVGLFNRTPTQLYNVCAALDIKYDLTTVFEAMAWHDGLATSMARLLLWTDPKPLPAVGDQQGAWDYYLGLWRPGMPRPDSWPSRYQTALALVQGTPNG